MWILTSIFSWCLGAISGLVTWFFDEIVNQTITFLDQDLQYAANRVGFRYPGLATFFHTPPVLAIFALLRACDRWVPMTLLLTGLSLTMALWVSMVCLRIVLRIKAIFWAS